MNRETPSDTLETPVDDRCIRKCPFEGHEKG